MQRRDFIRMAGLAGAGSLVLPGALNGRSISEGMLKDALAGIDAAVKKQLADAALSAAKAAGATYADVRIGRYLSQNVFTRENKVLNLVNTESYGAGIRVIVNGTWGFAATSDPTPESIAKTAQQAAAIAKANSKIQKEPVKLAPQQGYGEVSWKTPILKNSMEVPVKEKVDMLLEVNAAAMKNGADYITSVMFLVNEQKYFASTDGSYIDQDVHRIWPVFFATGIDKTTGKFEQRNSLSAPMGLGYEYVDPTAKAVNHLGVQGAYGQRYNMLEDAAAAGKQVKEKLAAKSVEAGKWDLVLDPSHLWLTIHESVGHPLELDRVLGYEANYAGTSFATMDKWQTKSFKYGSPIVNLVADKTQLGSLGGVGYDDEGVKTKRWHLVKDGILVNYQAIRDQVHMLGEKESHGCCYADNWASVQFQRMPNVSLESGKQPLAVSDMIKNVQKGIYIIGDGSFSIDQQRYNFQFGGQLFYEIKDGQIVGMLRDVAYQSNTQEFWNSCNAICDERDYRLGGSFFDGKGQPGQISSVSHGSSTTRFNGVNVINTARKL
jgi:TldD protein